MRRIFPSVYSWVFGVCAVCCSANGPGPVERSESETDAASADCKSGDPHGQQYFPDRDADGHGSIAPAGLTCDTHPPPGFVFSCDDCNDDNATFWQQERLYPDADNDGVGYGERVTLCTLPSPSGYSTTGLDCDDTDPAVQKLATIDEDGDRSGRWICVPADEPDILMAPGDCDDGDPTIYRGAPGEVAGDALDINCDGYGFPFSFGQRSVIGAELSFEVPDLPAERNSLCADQADALIVAARRAETSALDDIRVYVQIGNVGGQTAVVIVRETVTFTGEQYDHEPLTLPPLAVSEWIALGTELGLTPMVVSLHNQQGQPDCSEQDSSAEFLLRERINVP
jgi:hypothetical protein